MTYEFTTSEPPRLRGGIAAGRIEIETAETGQTTVEVTAIRGDIDNLKVEQRGRDIVLEQRKKMGLRNDEFDVRIRAPFGAEIDLNVASADIRAEGRYSAVDVSTASGDVSVTEIERDAKIKSASGDLSLGRIGGRAELNTASGDVHVESVAGGATVRSASGDVQIGEAAKQVTMHTASGDLSIGSIAEGSIDVKSASGDVRVGIRQGSRLHVDARSLSGDTSSEVELEGVTTGEGGPLVELKAATMSGDVRIVRA